MTTRHPLILVPVLATMALAACDSDRNAPEAVESATEKRSIFRPEFQVEPIEALEDKGELSTQILFPEGTELTEAARAELATVMASPQMKAGNAIVLRGHSDSGGTDEVNQRISRERAEAVRDWLVENGVDAERIGVIAFGEQNPAAPNAMPDGTPDEEGRAANRRVEIEIAGAANASTEQPTLAESLAETRDVDAAASGNPPANSPSSAPSQ